MAPCIDIIELIEVDGYRSFRSATCGGNVASRFLHLVFYRELFRMLLRRSTLRPPFDFIVARLHVGEDRRIHPLLHRILTDQSTGSLVGYLVSHERSHLSLHIEDTQIHVGSRTTATTEIEGRAKLVAGVTIHRVVLVGVTAS